MNLTSLLAQRAALHPERPALVDSSSGADRVLTFGELARRVACGAGFLHRMGLKRGHTILVFQPVSLELYEFLLASFHAGLRVMLADPSAGRTFLSQCCRRVPPDAFFGSWKAQCLRWMVPEMRTIPRAIGTGAPFPFVQKWHPTGTPARPTDLPDDEPALITFTSGSTGLPKAAVRTHGFLLAQHAALSHALDFEEAEVDLITLPVFVLANLASGLTSVLAATDLAHPGSPDTEAIRAQCSRHGVTRCAASPAFFEGFLASPQGMFPLAKLYTGGAPVFPDLLQRLRTSLPDSRIHAVYGSTEAEPIAHFDAAHSDPELTAITAMGGGLCAGPPIPEISLRILQDHWGTPLGPFDANQFATLTQPANTAGEIIVSGEHVLPGYLDGLGNEETKILVGNRIWHRTGDAGWIDSSGRLWLLGRCAEKLPPHPAPPGLPSAALSYPFAIESAMRALFPTTRMAALDWRGNRMLVSEKSKNHAENLQIPTRALALGIRNLIFLNRIPLDRRHQAKIDYPALKNTLSRKSP
jgi:olefin beta-lactone synthetase